jgi:tRNA-dihydrouridine synthase B
MRRHYSNYFKGLENFKEFRWKLVSLYEAAELFGVLDEIEVYYAGLGVSRSAGEVV